MKAILWTNYGPPDVLQLAELEKPAPKDNDVLIRVHATTVTMGDCEMRAVKFPLFLSIPMRLFVGLGRPVRKTLLGMEFAGQVEAAGRNVTGFKPGERVFGTSGFLPGTYAEYVCLPVQGGETEGALAKMPGGMTYEQAAALPIGGLEALHFLRKAEVRAGQTILINGAGGTIGTFAVQLARHLGAEVTAVDSGDKLDMLRSIGAQRVVDYTRADFTRNGETYDVIFDVVGRSPFWRSVRSLKQNGILIIANPRFSHFISRALASRTNSRKVIIGTSNHKAEDLAHLAALMESGVIKTVIDRRYPLEQAAEAHRYVESGAKQGNVVLTLD